MAPATDNTGAQDMQRGVARATGVLALGNISSRILGLVREIVLSNLFGATAAVDAFNVAIVVPKGLYDLLIGGHVNGAIVPVLSEIVALKGRDELWRVVAVLLSLMTAAMTLLVLLIELAAPLVIRVVAGGLDADTQALAALLLRVTSPALIFMSLFAILSGALYALRVYTWPAFGTAVFNGAIVTVTLLLAPAPEFQVGWSPLGAQWTIARPANGIVVVAFGWLVGSIAYVALQLPGLRGAPRRVRAWLTLHWRHPAIRQIGLLYVPVMFSLVMDTLVIRPFSYNLASRTGAGSVAYMNWATTLIQFPQGLVATAISIAILPTLSRQAALIMAGDDPALNLRAFRDTLGLGLRLAITLILPATIGLLALAVPIVDLLFEHGAFTAADTQITAAALRWYLIGLPFAAVDLLLVYAFYARQDTLTPALVGLLSLTVYMIIAVALVGRFGLFSLMIADSAKHIVHALISGGLLARRMNGLSDQRLTLTMIKSGAAAAALGVCAWGLLAALEPILGAGGLIHEMALVLICGGVSGAVFLAVAVILEIEEWRWLGGLIRRRLKS
jgi:putative peptidoglycan lipid II flippase